MTSIRSKIVLSYIVLLLTSFLIAGLLFILSARTAAEKEAVKQLQNDARLIEEYLNGVYDGENEATEKNLRQFIKEKKTLQGKAFSSHWGVATRDFKVLIPRNGQEAELFSQEILPQLKGKFLPALRRPGFRIWSEGVEYRIVIKQIAAGALKKKDTYIILYNPVQPDREFMSSAFKVLFQSMAITLLPAVLFGLVLSGSLAGPVIKLKKRAELLSRRDFDTRIPVNTGDELEELSRTIDRMAVELKEYDIAQKRFLQNASHELKTPLMSIQGYAEGIKDGVFEDNRQALDIIVEESTRLKGIVEELIYLSKLETMEDYYCFREESIHDILEKSAEKVQSLAMKNHVRIHTVLYKDQVLQADRDKLTQALINILGNCLRHAHSEIGVVTANDGRFFRIEIYDDGKGFEESEINKVFERFYKGKNGDTGLGMAITKVIIEKHGGKVEADNRPEGGARFTLTLPVIKT